MVNTFKKICSLLLITTLGFVSCDSDDDSNDIETTTEELEQVLLENNPYITTAIFKVVDGEVDRSINFISDAEVSANTISLSSYKEDKFVFVVGVDSGSGEFNEPITLESTGVYGRFRVIEEDGVFTRELFDTSFGFPSLREIVELTPTKFTYSFSPMGNPDTFYVEHEPYATKFPNLSIPSELTEVINERFDLIQ